MKIEDFDFDDILINENSCENTLVYQILYKGLVDVKQLRIRFDKIDGFITAYDGTRYLVLCGTEKYDVVYNRIRYLISQKMVLHMLFLIFMQELKLTHRILCLQRKHCFSTML